MRVACAKAHFVQQLLLPAICDLFAPEPGFLCARHVPLAGALPDAPSSTAPETLPASAAKAKRMSVLMKAQHTCIPAALTVMCACQKNTQVELLPCCNIDCKGRDPQHRLT